MKAVWNGAVIAASDTTTEVEGNVYFPLESVNRGYLLDSPTISVCPWKGEAHYFSIKVGDEVNRDAAWYYPAPKPGAEAVSGRVAFWRGVQVL